MASLKGLRSEGACVRVYVQFVCLLGVTVMCMCKLTFICICLVLSCPRENEQKATSIYSYVKPLDIF